MNAPVTSRELNSFYGVEKTYTIRNLIIETITKTVRKVDHRALSVPYVKNNANGQRKEGVMDRHTYAQQARQNALRGQELPHSKLLDMDVIDIRSAHRQRIKLLDYIRNNLSNEALAKKHGVHVRSIEKIVSYETWGHVA